MFQSNSRLRKFFSFYKPYKGLFLADVLCALLVAAIALTLPLCIRHITGTLLAEGAAGPTREILKVGTFMLGLIVVQTGCSLFYDYMGHAMGGRMERDMRGQLFAHYQKLPYSFFDENNTGQLMSRITNDLISLAELYHHGPEDLIIYSLEFGGALVILFQINRELTLTVCAFLPVMLLYSLFFNKKLARSYKRSRERIGDINGQLEDSLAGIRMVKSFANEALETEKFGRSNQRFYESRADIYKHEAYYFTGMEAFFTQLISVAVIVFGAIRISGASLSLADLIPFLLYVGYLTAPIPKLAHIVQLYQEGISGFNRFMDMMDIPTEDDTGTHQLRDVKGHVEFDNVSFRYREGHECVLNNISLNVRAGEYIALVGSSGAGKTTLCSLLPRFYDVSEGEIRLDGIDIRQITLQSLRKSIGVVQQEVYLFAGTVCDNILYGRPDATREEVIEAAKKANAHDFILELPDGYDTDIGQRGVKLSGGQKQRLSIARVFLKNPPILIFDEATSALDNESERAVQDSLGQLAKGRTTFVIAHRLTTIRGAERIIVLTDSGVEEQGTHDELLACGGSYAHLYSMYV